jgi:hypothetical protein
LFLSRLFSRIRRCMRRLGYSGVSEGVREKLAVAHAIDTPEVRGCEGG